MTILGHRPFLYDQSSIAGTFTFQFTRGKSVEVFMERPGSGIHCFHLHPLAKPGHVVKPSFKGELGSVVFSWVAAY